MSEPKAEARISPSSPVQPIADVIGKQLSDDLGKSLADRKRFDPQFAYTLLNGIPDSDERESLRTALDESSKNNTTPDFVDYARLDRYLHNVKAVVDAYAAHNPLGGDMLRNAAKDTGIYAPDAPEVSVDKGQGNNPPGGESKQLIQENIPESAQSLAEGINKQLLANSGKPLADRKRLDPQFALTLLDNIPDGEEKDKLRTNLEASTKNNTTPNFVDYSRLDQNLQDVKAIVDAYATHNPLGSDTLRQIARESDIYVPDAPKVAVAKIKEPPVNFSLADGKEVLQKVTAPAVSALTNVLPSKDAISKITNDIKNKALKSVDSVQKGLAEEKALEKVRKAFKELQTAGGIAKKDIKEGKAWEELKTQYAEAEGVTDIKNVGVNMLEELAKQLKPLKELPEVAPDTDAVDAKNKLIVASDIYVGETKTGTDVEKADFVRKTAVDFLNKAKAQNPLSSFEEQAHAAAKTMTEELNTKFLADVREARLALEIAERTANSPNQKLTDAQRKGAELEANAAVEATEALLKKPENLSPEAAAKIRGKGKEGYRDFMIDQVNEATALTKKGMVELQKAADAYVAENPGSDPSKVFSDFLRKAGEDKNNAGLDTYKVLNDAKDKLTVATDTIVREKAEAAAKATAEAKAAADKPPVPEKKPNVVTQIENNTDTPLKPINNNPEIVLEQHPAALTKPRAHGLAARDRAINLGDEAKEPIVFTDYSKAEFNQRIENEVKQFADPKKSNGFDSQKAFNELIVGATQAATGKSENEVRDELSWKRGKFNSEKDIVEYIKTLGNQEKIAAFFDKRDHDQAAKNVTNLKKTGAELMQGTKAFADDTREATEKTINSGMETAKAAAKKAGALLSGLRDKIAKTTAEEKTSGETPGATPESTGKAPQPKTTVDPNQNIKPEAPKVGAIGSVVEWKYKDGSDHGKTYVIGHGRIKGTGEEINIIEGQGGAWHAQHADGTLLTTGETVVALCNGSQQTFETFNDRGRLAFSSDPTISHPATNCLPPTQPRGRRF